MKTREQWETEISDAEADLDAKRRHIRNTQDKMRDAKTRRDAAVMAFQSGIGTMTPLENIRQSIDRSQSEKARNVAEGRAADDPGTREAHVVNSTDAWRQGRAPVGFAGRRRGTYAASERGRNVKLPSER